MAQIPKFLKYTFYVFILAASVIACLTNLNDELLEEQELIICHNDFITTIKPTPAIIKSKLIGTWIIQNDLQVSLKPTGEFFIYSGNLIESSGMYMIKLENNNAILELIPRSFNENNVQVQGIIYICGGRILHAASNIVWRKYN